MTTLIVVLLIAVGFIFLAIEFFLVPGFSVPGIAGITMIGYGIYKSSMEYGASGALIAVSLSAVTAVLLIRVAMKSRAIRNVGLDYSQKGTTAVNDYSFLLNKKGVARSNLRPSGSAIIEDKYYDVVTDGEYIEENSEIIVAKIEGTRIIVSQIERR
jgi:membrane-bound serine protease (ClpP class)